MADAASSLEAFIEISVTKNRLRKRFGKVLNVRVSMLLCNALSCNALPR
jgi:DNA-binding Xre family transcriptional regulator